MHEWSLADDHMKAKAIDMVRSDSIKVFPAQSSWGMLEKAVKTYRRQNGPHIKKSTRNSQEAKDCAEAVGAEVFDSAHDSARRNASSLLLSRDRSLDFNAKEAFMRFHYLRWTTRVFKFFDVPHDSFTPDHLFRLFEIGWLTPDDIDFAIAREMLGTALLERFQKLLDTALLERFEDSTSRKAWDKQRPQLAETDELPSFEEFQQFVICEEIYRLTGNGEQSTEKNTSSEYKLLIAQAPRPWYDDIFDANHLARYGRFGLKAWGFDDEFVMKHLQVHGYIRVNSNAFYNTSTTAPNKSIGREKKRGRDDEQTHDSIDVPEPSKRLKISGGRIKESIRERISGDTPALLHPRFSGTRRLRRRHCELFDNKTWSHVDIRISLTSVRYMHIPNCDPTAYIADGIGTVSNAAVRWRRYELGKDRTREM